MEVFLRTSRRWKQKKTKKSRKRADVIARFTMAAYLMTVLPENLSRQRKYRVKPDEKPNCTATNRVRLINSK